jgi:hypothetical protein
MSEHSIRLRNELKLGRRLPFLLCGRLLVWVEAHCKLMKRASDFLINIKRQQVNMVLQKNLSFERFAYSRLTSCVTNAS